jgi:hypothetical protein
MAAKCAVPDMPVSVDESRDDKPPCDVDYFSSRRGRRQAVANSCDGVVCYQDVSARQIAKAFIDGNDKTAFK